MQLCTLLAGNTENGLLGVAARFLSNDEVEVLHQSLLSLGLPAIVSSDTRYIVAYRLVQEFSVLFCKVQELNLEIATLLLSMMPQIVFLMDRYSFLC